MNLNFHFGIVIKSKVIKQSYKQKAKQLYLLMLIKNKNQLISHYNDIQDNHTYYLLNIQKSYEKAISVDYSQKKSKFIRCQYCKAFPFQVNNLGLNKNQSNNQEQFAKQPQKKLLKTLRQKQKFKLHKLKARNYLECALCQSISQKQLKLDLNEEQLIQKQSMHESGFLTSYLVDFEPNQNNLKNNQNRNIEAQFDYQLRLIFFLDFSLNITILEHFKNVILQIYRSLIQQKVEQTDNNKKYQKIAIFILIDAKLNILNLNATYTSFQTVCLQSFVTDKQPFGQVIQKCIFECTQQNLTLFQEFLNIIIQSRNQGKYKGYSLDGSRFFQQIIKSLRKDNSPLNYYMPIWIGKIPPVNYTQNGQGYAKNICTSLFLFYESYKKQIKRQKTKKFDEEAQQFQSQDYYAMQQFNLSIKNQLQIISDNNEVQFLQDKQQNLQFYYKFYQIFQVYSNIKLFSSRVEIKANSKYPPKILSKHYNLFNLKNSLYFLIRSDNNSNIKKFQISIQFDDVNQRKKLLLINWTTQNLQVMDRFVHIYSCIQFASKHIFNQLLSYKKRQLNKKQSQGQNWAKIIDINSLTLFLNDFMYKNTKSKQNQIIHDIYQFFLNNKRNPFCLLNFLSACESFFTVYRIYPIVLKQIVYWVEGYGQSQKIKIGQTQNELQNQQALQEYEDSKVDIVQNLNDYCQVYYCNKAKKIPYYYEKASSQQQGKYFNF